MVEIVFKRHRDEVGNDRYIMTADGHAGAGEAGKDIVCAAVSVLMDTLCDSLLFAADTKSIYDPQIQREGGHYSIAVYMPEKQTYEGVEMYSVFATILRGLRLVEEAYPEYVQIQTLLG